ncbi:MAG: serine/threonine protein kinase [Gemmatimonadaceae bacterium]|nr:serine/threonine protein kinase [Gemmatimonadaceae bacterium]
MTIDAATLAPRLQAAVGDTLQVGEVLGVGGSAAVFRARDPFLEREVAIKVLDPSLALGSELEEQFLQEARIVAGVEHPHIVPLYDAAVRGGLLYLVMRMLPGQSLADRIRSEGALAPTEAARLAHEVAMALAAAHERGVVHRDIKPENILLDASGHATVTDFGISRVTGRTPREDAGVTSGTPSHMSPEQALGEDVDGRSDVYALGVVLFEMLTGRLPFEGRSLTELMAKIISAPTPQVAKLKPETPSALAALVTRMLAKEREQRPTAAELASLLAEARAPEVMLTPRQAAWKKRKRRLVIAGVALGSAAVVLYGVYRVGVVAFRLFFSSPGQEPTIFADSAMIPPALLAEARAEGALQPDEPVKLVFIPGGRTASDAAFFTDSFVVRRSPNGARRVLLKGAELGVNRAKLPSDTALRGYLIVSRGKTQADTLYDDLGGLDVTRLLMSLYAHRNELGVKDK